MLPAEVRAELEKVPAVQMGWEQDWMHTKWAWNRLDAQEMDWDKIRCAQNRLGTRLDAHEMDWEQYTK